MGLAEFLAAWNDASPRKTLRLSHPTVGLTYSPMGSAFDVIIVGGGAAGVGAARRLAAHGKTTLLLEASSRLGGRAFTQDLGGYPLDLGCEWLHSGDRNAWVGIAEASGFPVDRGDPPWTKAHPSIAEDEDDQEAA